MDPRGWFGWNKHLGTEGIPAPMVGRAISEAPLLILRELNISISVEAAADAGLGLTDGLVSLVDPYVYL